MTREEARKRIRAQKALCCVGCMHPQEIGYCENTCKLPEAYDTAIEALQAELTHGRPIDADALSKKLCGTTIFIKDGELFQRMINDAPTVQADRPHGEWYQIKDHKIMGEGYLWHCSICDYKVYQDSSKDYPTENFCPNCGADMRGEDE